jgi:hypothetical protein
MPWFVVALGMLAAQSPDNDVSLKRIRDALAVPPAPLTITADSIEETPPVFRVRIEQPRRLELAPAWEPDRTVPAYVRTTRRLYHHEFLLAVTPEEFRSGTLYPGPDMLPLLEAPVRAVDAAITTLRERRARDKVTKQLQQLLFIAGK